MVVDPFWEGFWEAVPSKVSVWCRRGAILQNSHIFENFRFGKDCLMILSRFGSHFESQNATKMVKQIAQKIDGFLDRSCKGFGAPREARPRLEGDRTGPRRGVGER